MTLRLESGALAVGVLPERVLDLGVATVRGQVFSWSSRREGRLPELAPGEARTSSLEIFVEAA